MTQDVSMKNLTPEAVAGLLEYQISQLLQARAAAQETLDQIDAKLGLLEPALAALRSPV